MDRLIYIAMTGAQQQFHQQAVTANNLANASTAIVASRFFLNSFRI